ncbi:aminotransferase class I/II-fold pyridoxal phosphate-dependent enzyme [Sessilibacter corallicola]|uniref:Aminotransferase class I/II-fold pyridoxal phosphate-dependent enzyme n=2 Tax=Sessilibacter corallicola TaxID=2904075 RepID=A0ABQ0A9Z0_9GAMM
MALPENTTLEYSNENYIDITQHEIEALKTEFNLADAHTHQSQSETQKEIINDLPNLWYAAERKTQYQSEQEFIEKFYTLHGQTTALKRKDEIYLVYAASIGMHITATYLMQRNMRVGLIEPCFDNLHDLMKHMRVPLSPIDESLLYDASNIYDNLMKNAIALDAVFLVDPNNPTGFSLFDLDAEGFIEVVRFCKDYNKLLILDLCFSAFVLANGKSRFDIYEILENSKVSYIAMEDTGKTWPIQDTKCSTLHTSKDINNDVYNILTSVLLNVSPFILNLVSRYLDDSKNDKFSSVNSLISKNRQLAIQYLDGGLLKYYQPKVDTSVAWFEITNPDVTSDQLQQVLVERNVYVLPGKYFYWAHPERGQRYIRVALARNTDMFTQAMITTANIISETYGK